eukprot:PITA_31958
MSCNGCRVLRKGCSESCILSPCLHWIPTAESQANAIIFLAKFYGRAGLTNLISNGPEHLRPAIFRSLLYEACGRIVNPVYGLLGLVLSGKWAECQAGVDSILRGSFRAVPQGNFMSPECKSMIPVEATAVSELRRSVKSRRKLKGLSDARHKRREGERVPLSNHIQFSGIPDDRGDLTNTVQDAADKCKFNDKRKKKCSTIFSGQENAEFVAAGQAAMDYYHDICNLKTSQPEAACNPVGLEFIIGSQASTSPGDK